MNKKISELNEASELLEGDVLAIVQQGETKKVKAKLFCECGSADLSILDVRPGVDAGEIDLIDQGVSDNFPEFKHVHVWEGDKFLFKKGNVISIHPKVIVYLSNQDQYFKLTLQIYNDEFNSIYTTSVESPMGIETGEPYTLDIPTYLLTLNKSIHYIKTKLDNFILEPIDIQVSGGDHTCDTINSETGLVLVASSNITGGQFSWTVPLGFEEHFENTYDKKLSIPYSFIIGEFTITVTDPTTGRHNSKTVVVNDNSTPPSCFTTFVPSNNTIVAVENPGPATYTYSWEILDNPSWSIVSGQGTRIIKVSPGPINSTAIYTVVIRNVENGCTEDCSLRLRRTATGIESDIGGNPQ